MKLSISGFFSLFAVLFLLNYGEAEKSPYLEQSNTKSVKTHLKNGTTDSLEQQLHFEKSELEQENCETSGQSPVYSKHYKLKSPLHFAHRVDDWVDDSLFYIRKGAIRQCPEFCMQINSYQVSSKIYPQTVIKGSCTEEQSKEIYAFKKRFFFDKSKKSVKKTHKEMTEWVLATFVYPYFPIPFLEPTRESIEHNISRACPSCSFYLDYTYQYTEDKALNLDITARCGDAKKFMFDFKAEFALVNNWSCKKPGAKTPSEKESSSGQKTAPDKEATLEKEATSEKQTAPAKKLH